MERSSWVLIVLVSVGAAALVLAFAPGAWPNPVVEDGVVVETRAVPQFARAMQAVDAACRAGDGKAFAAVTTASYRRGLERRLLAVDGSLDGETLRAMARSATGYAQWLERPIYAMHANRSSVAVAVQREPARDGAQILVFEWDGEQFRLDEVRHAPRVLSAEAARRYLTELLRLR